MASRVGAIELCMYVDGDDAKSSKLRNSSNKVIGKIEEKVDRILSFLPHATTTLYGDRRTKTRSQYYVAIRHGDGGKKSQADLL